MYFPQETTEEMGATRILPGSHLRRVRSGWIAGYQNIVGQKQLACPAGSLFLVHADLWHCARPNFTDRHRYMFKMRLHVHPGRQERGWFHTEGYADPDLLDAIFQASQPWQGEERREDQIQRAKLWRYLRGDDEVDAAAGQLGVLNV